MTLDANAREEHRLMMRQLQENDGPFVDEEGNAIRRNARYYPERLENGETRAELLARSKGLLMMSPEKWTDTQKERAEILFREFPDIKTAFSLTHSLRMISRRGVLRSKVLSACIHGTRRSVISATNRSMILLPPCTTVRMRSLTILSIALPMHQQNPSMQRSSISEHNSEVLLTVSSFSSD